MNWKVHFGRHL